VDGVDEIPDEIAGVEILDNGNPLLDRGNPLLDRTEDIAGADGTTEPEAEEREPGVEESTFDEILGTDEDTGPAEITDAAEDGAEIVTEEKKEGELDTTPEPEGETACPDFKDAAEEGDETKVDDPGVDLTEIGGVEERAFDGILEAGRAEFTEAAEYGAEIVPEETIEGALDTTHEAEGDVACPDFKEVPEEGREGLKLDDPENGVEEGAFEGILEMDETGVAEFTEAAEEGSEVAPLEEKIEGEFDPVPEEDGEMACPDFKDAAEEGTETTKLDDTGMDLTEIGAEIPEEDTGADDTADLEENTTDVIGAETDLDETTEDVRTEIRGVLLADDTTELPRP
jgi:hypothetical protein